MRVYGLTGGIASGKSTVAKMLHSKGIPVVDADVVAREVVAPNSIGLKKIVDHFGEGILGDDGALDRQKLGKIVFNNPEHRKKLESITHPRIFQGIAKKLGEFRSQGHSLALVEAALMVETGSFRLYEGLVVVGCEKEQQLQRLMSRNNFTNEEAQSRIDSQMPLSEKRKVANYYVDNSSTIEELQKQIDSLIDTIL
jgi:dephospho-CoA kinase